MDPYTISDEVGATIEVLPCDEAQGRHGYLRISGDDGNGGVVTASACVDLLNAPGLMAALFKVAGKQPPLILDRPRLAIGTAAAPLPVAGFDVWTEGRRVHGRDIEQAADGLAPSAARMLAAVLVAHADDADAEPDPADVEDLAVVLAGARNREGHPHDIDRKDARAILRAGYRKQAAA